jgi:hypothetical protein
MGSALLERYDDRIAGVLSCYDRVVITGTLPTVCYAAGMTKFLNASQVRIFDYPRFAEPLRELVREQAASLAVGAGITIEHIGKKHVRKEAVVAKVLEQRGEHPGLVHVISAMEGCDTYKPWHDKQTGKTYLRPDKGQCLHYYFYFMDAELGLIHLRVPTPAFAGAGYGLRSACNSTATATADWQSGWRRKASPSPRPTTPSPASRTGNAPRILPTGCPRTSCTVCSTGMPRCAARCSTFSAKRTTGA